MLVLEWYETKGWNGEVVVDQVGLGAPNLGDRNWKKTRLRKSQGCAASV